MRMTIVLFALLPDFCLAQSVDADARARAALALSAESSATKPSPKSFPEPSRKPVPYFGLGCEIEPSGDVRFTDADGIVTAIYASTIRERGERWAREYIAERKGISQSCANGSCATVSGASVTGATCADGSCSAATFYPSSAASYGSGSVFSSAGGSCGSGASSSRVGLFRGGIIQRLFGGGGRCSTCK